MPKPKTTILIQLVSLLVASVSLLVCFCLISIALRYFGLLSDGLGIYAFGFDLTFGFCHLKSYGKAETIPGKAEGL